MKQNFFLRFATAAGLVFSLGLAQLHAANSVDTVITNGLFEPFDVAIASDGTAYLTDGGNQRVLKIPAGGGAVGVLAGATGTAGTNNGSGAAARFSTPQGIVLARGGLVVADSANHTLRFVTLAGVVSTLAGVPGGYGHSNGPAATARFRFPLGLAADEDGNIYIADSQNNAIRKLDTNNVVTTVASNFFQPAAVTVGANGELWVADTRRHCIKRIETNGVVTLVAGTPNVSGAVDASIATEAQFSSPRGLYWISPSAGLLISDSGNHAIRRLYYDTNFGSYSVETYAGTLTSPGTDDGAALQAKFSGPVGLARDLLGGGYLVVDRGNNRLRRINTGAVQPPIADPQIGWVDLVPDGFGSLISVLRPVVSGVFNQELVIAIPTEAGTQVYYTFGPTPENPFEDTIPDPGPGVGFTPPIYRDGMYYDQIPQSIVAAQPDVTIKAIGVGEGRRSSAIVSARFIFKVGNPTIVGDNAGSFMVANVTSGAEMWYTWDGSEPTNNPTANTNVFGPVFDGDTISVNPENSNRTIKIRGFKNGFRPSDLVQKTFSPSNFMANTLSFGFASGEGSSVFVASAGQRFFAPVTLTLLPQQKMYSLQFSMMATGLMGPAIDPNSIAFESTLQKPDPLNPGLFVDIPPLMAVPGGGVADATLLNPAINLLGVGWLERAGGTNVYDATAQDLIRYSQAYDTQYTSDGGKVIVGVCSFVVPLDAPGGSQYLMELDRASATANGINQDVYIHIPTNGSLSAGTPINGRKIVRVAGGGGGGGGGGGDGSGVIRYIVGDVTPFRWFNAGDFGDGLIQNSDVLKVFLAAVYGLNVPSVGSDLYDAMDSSDGSVNVYDGSDYSIDSVRYGDGLLNVDDVFVTFRRSLDPTLKWYARYWSNGFRAAVEVTNTAPPKSMGGKPAAAKTVTSARPSVVITADDVVGAPGTTVDVPIRIHLSGGASLRVAMMGLTVQAIEGAPTVSQPVSLTPSASLGSSGVQSSKAANHTAAAWLNTAVTGVSGDTVFATVRVTIPANAGSDAAYRLHFDHFSGSENGLTLFKKYVTDGIVSTRSRAGSAWNDAIPDVWRLRFFGAISNAMSAASADPDRDGVNNLNEFLAGTNPFQADSVLSLKSAPAGPSALKLFFPTGTGRTYVIDCAPDVTGPWSPLTTNVGDGAVLEYINTAPGVSQRFYRVRTQ